jgi:hypothetical protein
MSRHPLSADVIEFACSRCGRQTKVAPNAYRGDELNSCAYCGGHEVFSRKDFSPRLGLAIVIAGALASCVAWGFYRQ